MARTAQTDYLQNHRFHVTSSPDYTKFEPDGLGEAGFSSVTFPELSMDAVEYREGIFTWTKKQVGIPTWSDVDLMRGVTKRDTKFFEWAMKAAVGGGEYRTDLVIYTYGRDEAVVDGMADRKVKCYNCIPIRCKLGGDLDASTGDVSLQEVSIAIEWAEFDIDGKLIVTEVLKLGGL
jgi:phage tail-like protein